MQHPAAHLVVILCIQLIQKCMWEVYNYSFILFQPALMNSTMDYDDVDDNDDDRDGEQKGVDFTPMIGY